MEHFTPKYRYDPNEKVESLYFGVGNGNTTVTRVVKKSRDSDSMETSRTYERNSVERLQGGYIGTFIIGGMETTMDEMRDILEAKKEKKWVPRRSGKEIADMCRALIEQRNDDIKYYRKNPSEAPKPKPKPVLYLPTGYQYVDTSEPGLKILAQV